MKRGDVVLLDFPFIDRPGSKVRPAVVVQNDRDNARLRNAIAAIVTGNLRRAGEPTQVLVDPATPEGARSGLHGPSLVSANNPYTVDQAIVIRVIGFLPMPVMRQVDDALKAALGL